VKLTRIQLKLYAELPGKLAPSDLVPVFHAWIRERKLDETLVDVVDYAHVHQGPGILLIGHAADYGFDLSEGRPGLLYFRKREGPALPAERLRDAFSRALSACRLLEQEPSLGGLRFRTDELRLSFPDRLETPSSDAVFAELRPLIEPELARLLAPARFELVRESTEKEPLTLRVRAPGARSVQELLPKS
jgi:hypothetical protein